LINASQQDVDRSIDYQVWDLSGLELRGPRPDVTKPYVAALGAAPTFGLFTEQPYVNLVATRLGLQALNLGVAGAGPSFFMKRPDLVRAANGAEWAVVELFSGSSVANSRFDLGRNHAHLIDRQNPDAGPVGADVGYQHLIDEMSTSDLVTLRAEIRQRYIAEMSALLQQITVPTVLVRFARRASKGQEGTETLASYWGGYPHFVDQGVIDALRLRADAYLELSTPVGPTPSGEREASETTEPSGTGEPTPSHMPGQNISQASAEMHREVAEGLIALAPGKERARRICQKPVLVHAHIFKNAGSSFDLSLQRSFGASWRSFDPQETRDTVTEDYVRELVSADPTIRAFSSHQLRFPLFDDDNVRFFPVVFLRHPILRAVSIYDFERKPGRQALRTPHSIKAGELDLADYIEWCLSAPNGRSPVSNFQTLYCCLTSNSPQRGAPLSQLHLAEAVEHLDRAHVGIVEDFNRSANILTRSLSPAFPELNVEPVVVNASPGVRTLETAAERLGNDTFRKLVAANELDLYLYARYARLLAARGSVDGA